ncbi:MAG: hypothetical protein WCY97_08045 [Methanothrix sp.]|uniref:Uncharacterized protein n=1 Tax=Methanothrix harundinacea TaxID=301375 RepID=A0A101IHI3_9EURY|nr:MAG: Uncharacterized protein XD72_1550 [Methanothrix harundinacea]MDD2639316.1 hypothetical protein [Methanothrix sp.]MDI9398364.1 hypothetical protein [Euryarchaeota archaeon]KUK95369.1 MAG: Uncharacterized protein XE07_1828 [Methanothrix harundinacea]MDD3710434.1 hypothetical protein [Methanothrix sp.]
MNRLWLAVVISMVVFVGSAAAANYVFERSVIQGVGYRSHELIGQTAQGYSGQKIVERISGSGNFYDRTEFELNVHHNSINYTQEAEFEYFPVSYQTGTYDQKWVDKLCVSNYDAGAVVTEQYTHAESLMKSTEIRTAGDSHLNAVNNSGIEASFSSNVIGVGHIGWLSKDPKADSKGRHFEVGRSIEDVTGVFSIEKYIQLSMNETITSNIDWLPCL